MFRRKKRIKRVQVKNIPLPMLMRQAIYDSMLEPSEDIADAIGLSPISQEVADMEEQESEKRLERVAPLIPFLEAHSDMLSRICSAAIMITDEEGYEKLAGDDGVLDSLVQTFKIVSLSSSLSCLASLSELDLIDVKVVADNGK